MYNGIVYSFLIGGEGLWWAVGWWWGVVDWDGILKNVLFEYSTLLSSQVQ